MTHDTFQNASQQPGKRSGKEHGEQARVTAPVMDAPWWLGNGHAQTLYRKFSAAQQVVHSRQRVELSDGDFIDLDWALKPGEGEASDEQVVLIMHGLCGCSQSSYVLALQALLNRHNIASVAMNFRGCSGEPNRLARSYHSGASEDLREVVAHLSESYPQSALQIVGYSLGANVLLKYLGEEGEAASCAAAVAVSTPFRLADCSRAMLTGMSALYGRYFVNRLAATLQDKLEHLEAGDRDNEYVRMQALRLPKRFANIWQFDDLVTAPLHGFADAADYYAQCSSAGFLGSITTPTLLIQSTDDPIIPESTLPGVRELPSSVTMQLSRKGGHVGFVSASETDWLERRIVAHLAPAV